MDLVIVLLWSVAFSVIMIFLGALNYFLGRSHSDIEISDKKSQNDPVNQSQQSTRSTTTNNRRKQVRNANKKQRQRAAVAAAAVNSDNSHEDKQETESVSSTTKMDEEEVPRIELSSQLTDEESKQNEEFEDPMEIEEVFIPPHIEDEQKPTLPVKQRHKNKNHSTNLSASTLSISSKEELTLPSKPQACVAPVKQSFSSIPTTNYHSKSNGTASSSNFYSYPDQSHLPPRFQQQQQRPQKFRQRKPTDKIKKSFNSSASSEQQQLNNHNQSEPPSQSSNHNGYSSESDALTESSSTAPPPSTESQLSSKRSDIPHSSSNHFLDEFISIFDTTSFSSDQLELILNKLMTKHLRNKHDWQRLTSPSSATKTIETLIDETYRSQAKILAIELQTEKNRVLELAKVNADMDTTIRQLQQPNTNMASYQQTMLHYQMHIKRLTDENARLAHQLHAYSMMPASINELKQQQMALGEQLRQINMRNSNLEKEIADGDRATKHAAEIYRKADIQKQERIEQMINDINRYKKIETDLKTLQEKHVEFERNMNTKLDDLIQQRDQFRQSCEELNQKIQHYEEMNITDELQQELNEAKTKNDLLRQRNWKIMDQLNKLLAEQNSSLSSSE